MHPELLIIATLFFAIFVQSLIGFGSGLIAMPILAAALTLKVASPFFSLVALGMELTMLARYRAEFRLDSVWRLMLTIVIGIPLGIYGARLIDERVMLFLLGVIVSGYGVYGLVSPRLPNLEGRGWPFGMGLLSGLLTGAYNTGGPPLVIYATSQRWQPQEFKANMQSMFIVSSFTLIIGNLVGGHYTPLVLRYVAFGLPFALLGMFVGFKPERYVHPAVFRKGVLVLLVVLGLTLIF